MEQISIILIVNLLALITKTFSQSSPCPNIFQYQSDGQRNYGIITIPPPGMGRTVMQAIVGTHGSIDDHNSAGVRLLKQLDESVDDAKMGRPIQYILNLPASEQLPIILKLTLNNKEICRGPKVGNFSTWQFQHEFAYPSGLTEFSVIPNFPPLTALNTTKRPPTTTQHPPTSTPTIAVPPTPASPLETSQSPPSDGSWVNSLPLADTCGRLPSASASTQLIIGGEDVTEGEFPWLVALYHYKGRNPEFKCGASLISDTYVITAAQCVTNQVRVYMVLGEHNISNPIEDGYISRVSLEIIPHPDYVSGADGDIALIMIEKVRFTPKIKPICLWSLGTDMDKIVMRGTGTVAGWGQTENDGDSSTTSMKVNVHAVDLDVCRNSNDKLKDIATDKIFCAGGQKTSPCHRNSGSGFYIHHKQIWYLRGIISTSIGTNATCNLEEYAVYADLAFYLDWIQKYLT